MRQSEIKVGGTYVAKVSNKLTTVRVENIRTRHGYGSSPDRTVYDVVNLATGRRTTFRSATKFRSEVVRSLSGAAVGKPLVEVLGEDRPVAEKMIDDAFDALPDSVQQRARGVFPVLREQTSIDPTLVIDENGVTDEPDEPASGKPFCQLSGEDGNVFAIIGRVSRALRDAGRDDKAREFHTRAMSSASYDDVLNLCSEYVDAH